MRNFFAGPRFRFCCVKHPWRRFCCQAGSNAAFLSLWPHLKGQAVRLGLEVHVHDKSPKLRESESAPRVFLQKTSLLWVNLMNIPTGSHRNLKKLNQRFVFVKDMAGMSSDDSVMNLLSFWNVLPCLFQAKPLLKIPRPMAPTTTRGARCPSVSSFQRSPSGKEVPSFPSWEAKDLWSCFGLSSCWDLKNG